MNTPPKRQTKKQTAIRLLRRPQGASLQELQDRLNWQSHSVRGFVSTMGRHKGFEITSWTNRFGKRRYRLVTTQVGRCPPLTLPSMTSQN